MFVPGALTHPMSFETVKLQPNYSYPYYHLDLSHTVKAWLLVEALFLFSRSPLEGGKKKTVLILSSPLFLCFFALIPISVRSNRENAQIPAESTKRYLRRIHLLMSSSSSLNCRSRTTTLKTIDDRIVA